MTGTVPLAQLATVIRSKNAGPYEITFDVIFTDHATYAHVRDSGTLTEQTMMQAFGVDEHDIRYCDFFEPALAFKLTLIRPGDQGGIGERDTFGAQQHAPLLDIPIPAPSPPHSSASADASADPSLQQRFRDVMAGIATPVSVITAMTTDGIPHGTTVSAFASLSMTPPMVVVCLDRGSESLAVVGDTGYFGVNVLGFEHAELAETFARKGGAAKFDQVEWIDDHNLPRLPGAAWLACRVSQLVEGGDHIAVLGDVMAADTHEAVPLTYHLRAFGTHTSTSSVVVPGEPAASCRTAPD